MDWGSDSQMRKVLESYRVWAVVGCSPDPSRPSHQVAAFLQQRGYRIIPVHPMCEEILGEHCYPYLPSVPPEEGVEVVDVFRRPELAGRHVDEAIAMGAKAVWLQIGVVDEAAAQRAREAGLDVVMDRCPKMVWPRIMASSA